MELALLWTDVASLYIVLCAIVQDCVVEDVLHHPTHEDARDTAFPCPQMWSGYRSAIRLSTNMLLMLPNPVVHPFWSLLHRLLQRACPPERVQPYHSTRAAFQLNGHM